MPYHLLSDALCNKYTKVVSYHTGDIVFNQGELCQHIGFIEMGEIHVITITHTEKEETITSLSTGDAFGDLLLFSDHPYYLGHAICKKETVVRYIEKEQLPLLFQNKAFFTAFLSMISNKAMQLKNENKLLRHSNLKDRMMHYLIEEQLRTHSSTIQIENITAFATLLSFTRPTVSKALQQLVKEGEIEIRKKGQTCWIRLLHPDYIYFQSQ